MLLNFYGKSQYGQIPVSHSKIYLAGYNGELREERQLTLYKNLKDFKNLTIHELNRCHHVDYKSISIGNLLK